MIGWGKGFLSEASKAVLVSPPSDKTGAATTTLLVNMQNWRRVEFMILTGNLAGNSQAVALTQAVTSGGTPKALAFDTGLVWKSVGQSQTADSDALVQVTVTSDAFNITNTDDNGIFRVNVRGDMLDINNGYKWVGMTIATPGASATLIAVVAILYDGWYSSKETVLPTAVG